MSTAPAPAELVLRLFGPFDATINGLPLPRLRSRKEQHLLALLALRAPRPAERVWLAGLLWPDSTEEAALSNLRRSLHLVRAALGETHGTRLRSPTPATLALDTDGVDVDVCAFDAALQRGTLDALEAAVTLHSAPLLEDCAEDWALAERAARQETLLAACETCGVQCAASSDHARAARLLRRALPLDPLRETLVRLLMQSLAASGDAAGAMDTFRRFRRRLRRELDAAPSPETRALLGTISDALSPLPAVPLRLPRPLTLLVGRRQEVRETVTALDTSRLVTLTGTGGVGKTRLAIAAAEDLAEECEVCFVPLAALTHSAPLAPAVAHALEITGLCDTPDALCAHLRDKSLLLVLDNCEHVLDGCASLAATLLEGCARLRVLATSRQPLGLPGEAVRPVPLLPVPPPEAARRPDTDYDAVQLFLVRAKAARSSFSADPRTLPAVSRICRRLDGLPLALELAAARVRSLSCEQIAQNLDDRFFLLASGNRGALPRHQTLRAAVDWSYDLLTEAERLLLCRLSVFAGGWTLEAAEAICAEENLPVADSLAGLVDKSLVQMQETECGPARYFSLETLRQYARDRLVERDEATGVQGRHAAYYLQLAEQAAPLLRGPEGAAWLERLEEEHGNLRTSLAWYAEEAKEAEDGLRLSAALWRFWATRGHYSEGRHWLQRMLDQTQNSAPSAVRAYALNGAGNLSQGQGEKGLARPFYEQSLAAYRQLGDQKGIANTLNNLGNVAMEDSDFPTARILLEESLVLHRQLNNPVGVAMLLNNLGNLFEEEGRLVTARALHEESLAISRQLRNEAGVACSLNNIADIACTQGDYAQAQMLFHESLNVYRNLGDTQGVMYGLEGLGDIADQYNQPARAVQLWAAAFSLREVFAIKMGPPEHKEIDRRTAAVHSLLGEEAFAAAWEAGRAMTLDEAVAFALQEVSAPPELTLVPGGAERAAGVFPAVYPAAEALRAGVLPAAEERAGGGGSFAQPTVISLAGPDAPRPPAVQSARRAR